MNYLEILQKLYKLYPIGLPYRHDIRSSFEVINDVISRKADNIQEGVPIEPWHTIFLSLKEEFKEIKILNLTHYTLPSLSLLFFINSSEQLFLTRRIFIKVSLSLILPYYTMYVEEDLFYEPDISRLFVKYVRIHLTELENDIIKKTKDLITLHYPNYTFLDSEDLKIQVMGGVPIGADLKSTQVSYPLFDFIFGRYN